MNVSVIQNWLETNQKSALFFDYLSLTKPRLSLLVIFTSALGIYLAPTFIPWTQAFVSILATSGLVGGACAINCYMEKDVDALMNRTKDRPLPSGRIPAQNALILGTLLIFTCLFVLWWQVNTLTAVLGLIASVVYVFLYTPLKKKTSWALFVGAIPGAIPPLMGWTTVTNSIDGLGLVLFGILFVWQLPHFLSISIYHAEDYQNAQIKVLPSYIGVRKTIHRIVIYTLILLGISLAPYFVGATEATYFYLISFLGGTYFLFSLMGYKYEEGSVALMKWARGYFYGSLVYLPLVFVLMIYFR